MSNNISSSSTPLAGQTYAGGTTGPAGAASTQAAPAAGTLSGGVSSLALLQNLHISELTAGPLGMATPANQGDSAALLAAVEAMLDQTASKGRANEINSVLGQARTSAGNAASSLATTSANLATETGDLATRQANEPGLEQAVTQAQTAVNADQTTIGQITTTMASLTSQIATEQAASHPDQAKIAALNAQLQTATTNLASAQTTLTQDQTTLANAQAAATANRTAMAKDTTDIAGNRAQIQGQVLQLVTALATLASTAQSGGGTILRNHEDSRELKQRFDSVNDTAARVDTDTTRRILTAADTKDRLTQDEKDNKVKQLAEGLGTGLAQLLDTLQQFVASASTGAPDAAQLSNARARLTL